MFCSLLKNISRISLTIQGNLRPANLFRNFSDEPRIIIGGGLDKPQGGMREEKYFSTQNNVLLAKLRDKNKLLKCESQAEDWKEFEKVLEPKCLAFRETCSVSKHKNALEEAFFLNEQNLFCAKLRKSPISETENLKSPEEEKMDKDKEE